jgi:hypothetical protein
VALEANMGPHTSEKMVGGLTWGHRIFGNEPDRKNMLRGHENGKCTDDQLVLLGHGIYSNAHLISNELISTWGEWRTLTQSLFVRKKS